MKKHNLGSFYLPFGIINIGIVNVDYVNSATKNALKDADTSAFSKAFDYAYADFVSIDSHFLFFEQVIRAALGKRLRSLRHRFSLTREFDLELGYSVEGCREFTEQYNYDCGVACYRSFEPEPNIDKYRQDFSSFYVLEKHSFSISFVFDGADVSIAVIPSSDDSTFKPCSWKLNASVLKFYLSR